MLFDEQHMKLLFDLKQPTLKLQENSVKNDKLETDAQSKNILTDLSDLSCTAQNIIEPFSISLKGCPKKRERKKKVTRKKRVTRNINIKSTQESNIKIYKIIQDTKDDNIAIKPQSPSLSIDSAIDLSADNNVTGVFDSFSFLKSMNSDNSPKLLTNIFYDPLVQLEMFSQEFVLGKETTEKNQVEYQVVPNQTNDFKGGLSSFDSTINYSALNSELTLTDENKELIEPTLIYIPKPLKLFESSKFDYENVIITKELYSLQIPILLESLIFEKSHKEQNIHQNQNIRNTNLTLENSDNLTYVHRPVSTVKINPIVNNSLIDLTSYNVDESMPLFINRRKRPSLGPETNWLGKRQRYAEDMQGITQSLNVNKNKQYALQETIDEIYDVNINMEDVTLEELSSLEPCFVSDTAKKDMFTECLVNLVSDSTENSEVEMTPPEITQQSRLLKDTFPTCNVSSNDNNDNKPLTSILLKENIAVRTMNFIVHDDNILPEGLRKLLPCKKEKSSDTVTDFVKSQNVEVCREVLNDNTTECNEEQDKKPTYQFNIAFLRSISIGILKKEKEKKFPHKQNTTQSNIRNDLYKLKQKKLLKAKKIVLRSKYLLRKKHKTVYVEANRSFGTMEKTILS